MGGRVRGSGIWGVWDGQVYTGILNMDSQQGLTVSTGTPAQCHVAAGMGGEPGGEGMHVCVWLSPRTVRLKLSQHC